MTISSIMEFISIGSIIPLISIFLEYEFNEESNFFIKIIYTNFDNISDMRNFFILTFGLLVISAAAIRLIVFRLALKYTALISSGMASNLYINMINKSYRDFIKESTNVLISNITEKNNKIAGVIYSLFHFLSGLIVTLGVLLALLVYNFQLTIIMIISLSILYLLVAKICKFILKKNSLTISKYSEYRIKFLQETTGNIREIILAKLHIIFSKIYSQSEIKYRMAEANINTVAGFPKIIIESFGIILLLAFSVIYFGDSSENKNDIIISLGVFAYAANRLLPMFNNIYNAWANLLGNISILEDLKKAIYIKKDENTFQPKNISKVNFTKVDFINVKFSYGDKNDYVFNNINFSFNLKKKIGVIGKTGTGKSTFIDLILGLLQPNSGKILLDNNELKDTILEAWQSQIAHVPQEIFLINDSIKKNITFNLSEEKIDTEKLNKAIHYSELKKFIDNLSEGLDTSVGENGINISGGQKQRIGIARALYKGKNILIMDEATSALDYETENKIIQNITENFKDITLISITHRLNSLKDFDQIINLNKIDIDG